MTEEPGGRRMSPTHARDRARLPDDVTPIDSSTVASLAGDLASAFGTAAVARDKATRLAASTDWAHLSPVLTPLLPGGVADIVVRPPDAAGIALAVALAHRHGVPVTPRGQGTGNYGQGIPLYGGLVVDTSRASRVLAVGEGTISAEAGASFVALEKAARTTGQELAILPSTVGSTIGGFIAGGAGGTGSLAHGAVWDGYLHELRVAACTSEPALHSVPFPENTAMAHAFGTSGVIAEVTIALAPAQDWTALFSSFSTLDAAVAAGEELFGLEPTPRLVSLDEPGIVATYRPVDAAMPPDRVSLRAIVTEGTAKRAGEVVSAHGGTVDAVRPKGAALLTSLSFNHVTHRLRKIRPELTHLQAMGPGLTRRRDEVARVAAESLVHLEGFKTVHGRDWVGMLFCRFDGADELYATMGELSTVDVDVNDPHTWVLHHGRLAAVREAARRFDPGGLLNPGKLPPV